MLTGELRSQIDAIWNSFWSGGISNPLEVMEQITYLLFLRRLDDLYTLEENKSLRLGTPMERRIFPEGQDSKGRAYDDLRWSRFKNFSAAEMYTVVGENVFPFLRTGVGSGDGSTYAHHMKDGGTREVIDRATEQSHGLGIFIRSLVGLDREAAAGAFSQFITGTTVTPDQIEFIDLVVQELTQNGVMDVVRLYQTPFIDISPQGPEGVFPSATVGQMVAVLAEIRQRAAA